MFSKIVCALAIVAFAAAAPQRNYQVPQQQYQPQPQPQYQQPSRPSFSEESYEEPAKYSFDWSVEDSQSGNNFGHEESRDGDNTQGAYYVLLPDGRTQKVSYYVNGESGFVAEVTYEGEARYDQPRYQAPQPQYQEPQPQPQYQQPQQQYQQSRPQYGF